jgi:hypothetical protein
MPTQIAAAEAKSLLVIRRLTIDGIESVSRGDDLSVRKGLLLVDLAAESLLKAVLRAHGRSAHPKSDFYKVMEDAIAAHGGTPPALAFARTLSPLHTMRNAVQHEGISQDAAMARTTVEQAREILSKTVREVWDRDFETMGVEDFIGHDATKRLLEAASKELEAGEYFRCAALARAIVDEAIARWTGYVRYVFHLDQREHKESAGIAGAVSLGAFLPGLARFRSLTEQAHAFVSVALTFQFMDHGWGLSKSDAEKAAAAREALDYASAMALQIEERLSGWEPDWKKRHANRF